MLLHVFSSPFLKVLLDDSTINIATIASSRYIGPLKTRVDDWQKQLALFNQTLVSKDHFSSGTQRTGEPPDLRNHLFNHLSII